MDDIEKWTGDRPNGCPWRAFEDPIVIDVIHAYRFWESGQLAQYWGPDPPAILVQAIGHYHMVLGKVREQQRELDRQNRK